MIELNADKSAWVTFLRADKGSPLVMTGEKLDEMIAMNLEKPVPICIGSVVYPGPFELRRVNNDLQMRIPYGIGLHAFEHATVLEEIEKINA